MVVIIFVFLAHVELHRDTFKSPSFLFPFCLFDRHSPTLILILEAIQAEMTTTRNHKGTFS